MSSTSRALRVRVSHAEHDERRAGSKIRAAPVGYALLGSCRAFFAGDTDVFPGLEAPRPGPRPRPHSDLGLGCEPRHGPPRSQARRRGGGAPATAGRGADPLGHVPAGPPRVTRSLPARSGGRVRGRRAREGARRRDPRAGSGRIPHNAAMNAPLWGFGTKRLVRGLQTGRVLPALFVTMIGLIFAFAAIMRLVDSKVVPDLRDGAVVVRLDGHDRRLRGRRPDSSRSAASSPAS